MAKNFNYFLEKNKDTNEITYIEYEKLSGYKVTPKTTKEDAIKVNKIVFVNPSLSEKIIRMKINRKISYLLKMLKTIDEDDSSGEDAIRKSLMDAERLKLMIINNYVKYLGHTYESLTLKKIQIIVNQLRLRLYALRDKEMEENYYQEEKKGKGR